MKKSVVEISKNAVKELKKIPAYIRKELLAWVVLVEEKGLSEARKIPSYHDEPLKGDRVGQRSIRLNRAYRAIYIVRENGNVEFIIVEEVNKHDY